MAPGQHDSGRSQTSSAGLDETVLRSVRFAYTTNPAIDSDRKCSAIWTTLDDIGLLPAGLIG